MPKKKATSKPKTPALQQAGGCRRPSFCSARSRGYLGGFYITIQEAGSDERKAAPGSGRAAAWKRLDSARSAARELLSWWDVNFHGMASAPASVLRIYDKGTLIEAHYWQNDKDQMAASEKPRLKKQ